MTVIEPVEELIIPTTHPRISKYRALIDNFITSKMQQGKITCNQLREAENVQQGLKRYKFIDEPIVIERRGNVVWIVKLS